MKEITWDEFEQVELRVGTVVRAEIFAEARFPAHKVWVDFGGDIGVRKTSARVADLYAPEDLVGRQVMGVVNFPVKQIGPIRSEFLLTGFTTDKGVVLAVPDPSVTDPEEDIATVPNGTKLA